ncbi:hypothetical protein [Flavobacterium crassostreae]|uniref:Carboxypeptidase-like regulatory domain-containing protein n=1 Tax=Flavobacterium crassostreae TaxID=1763534 RepID=A0A1B9E2C1_9FLAO|nr:hypothetical protein [Flavobacterium crassostreae]OCB76094.1 hypothetical protein LPBF_07225 [Flavobacterium crassostreae]
MKKCFFFLWILYSARIYSQAEAYSVQIKDIETQLPIENATLSVVKTKQILLSNSQGIVSFELKGSSSIQVSEATYETLNLRWSELQQNNYTVYLKSTRNALDEIILTTENPQKILKKIVANSIQKITVPARLKVYVREFFKLNQQYAYYNDGLVNFQFSKDQDKLSTTLLVEQNRSFGLLDQDITEDLLGYNLNDIMEKYCSFRYLDPILEVKNAHELDFLITAPQNNKKNNIMTITPQDSSENFLDTFEIIYDTEKKIIKEFTIKRTPKATAAHKDIIFGTTKQITNSFVKVNYRLDDQGYFLLNANENIAYDVQLKDTVKNIEVQNSFITTHFNKQNFTYKESDVFKEKTLFNKKNNILTNYWDFSGFIATEHEKEIIDSLHYKM